MYTNKCVSEWARWFCPTWHNNRSLSRRSPSQSLVLVWKKLNLTHKSTHSPIKRNVLQHKINTTRRPAYADRTARCQFQATGQPVSRTQASDAMTSGLPRYEAKCVQRRCFQWGSVPLRSDIKRMELPPANISIPLERQLIALQLCRWEFLYNETLQQI